MTAAIVKAHYIPTPIAQYEDGGSTHDRCQIASGHRKLDLEANQMPTSIENCSKVEFVDIGVAIKYLGKAVTWLAQA
jgi:hypothetical protein